MRKFLCRKKNVESNLSETILLTDYSFFFRLRRNRSVVRADPPILRRSRPEECLGRDGLRTASSLGTTPASDEHPVVTTHAIPT